MKHISTFLFAVMLFPGTNAVADIYMTELDLANNVVEIVNDGGADIDITSWWICNRVNGTPFYDTVANAISINGASHEANGVADLIVEAGDVLVLDVAAGFLPDTNGEFSFYNTNSFGSASAIEDYIAWGGPGIRDVVAQNAGIWTVDDFIDVSTLGTGETIQLDGASTGISFSEYFFATETLGQFTAVPEPTSLAVIAFGMAVGLGPRRR